MCGPISSSGGGLVAAIAPGLPGRASTGLSWPSSGMSRRLRRRLERPQSKKKGGKGVLSYYYMHDEDAGSGRRGAICGTLRRMNGGDSHVFAVNGLIRSVIAQHLRMSIKVN